MKLEISRSAKIVISSLYYFFGFSLELTNGKKTAENVIWSSLSLRSLAPP